MDSYILGVDIGTGSIKAVAITQEGKVISALQIFYETSHPKPGFSEQDPAFIFSCFIQIINQSIEKIGFAPVCISLSSAMHSLVVTDEKGNALSNLILWSDSRSAAIAEEIKSSKDAKKIYERTGTPIYSMSPLCKIIWMRENKPELFVQADKFISIKEYIWYQLFREFQIDHSLASGTGLFDIKKRTWYKKSLELAGINKDQLSKPLPASYIRSGLSGAISSRLNIDPGIPFCIGGGDGCLANLGSHALKKGIAAITIGTSGAVRISSPKPIRNFSIMNFNYILDENYYISGGPVNNGGSILQWVREKFLDGENISHDQLFAMADSVSAGSDGLIFLPYLHGERAPVWSDKISGLYFGIRSVHSKAHFVRSALEGVCFALKNILNILENESGEINEIHLSGGFIQSSVWVQMLANITEKKLCLIQNEDASAIGAAYMGMKAMGMIDNYNSLKQENKKEIIPEKDVASVYETNAKIFIKLYPALKTVMQDQTEI
jgi:gluconokinase